MLTKFSSAVSVRHRGVTLSTYRKAVERVIWYMTKHLDESMELKTVADIAGFSPFHFLRIFQQTTSVSPNKFLAALRMHAAKKILFETDKDVTNICYDVGYKSLGSFTTCFTKAVGLSPRQYRIVSRTVKYYHAAYFNDNLADFSPPKREGWEIHCPEPFSGIIYAALFGSAIQQGIPVVGSFVTDYYSIRQGSVPDGDYYLMVNAFKGYGPISDGSSVCSKNYYLGKQAVSIYNNKVYQGDSKIYLRRPEIIDPPILVSLSCLAEQSLLEGTIVQKI